MWFATAVECVECSGWSFLPGSKPLVGWCWKGYSKVILPPSRHVDWFSANRNLLPYWRRVLGWLAAGKRRPSVYLFRTFIRVPEQARQAQRSKAVKNFESGKSIRAHDPPMVCPSDVPVPRSTVSRKKILARRRGADACRSKKPLENTSKKNGQFYRINAVGFAHPFGATICHGHPTLSLRHHNPLESNKHRNKHPFITDQVSKWSTEFNNNLFQWMFTI